MAAHSKMFVVCPICAESNRVTCHGKFVTVYWLLDMIFDYNSGCSLLLQESENGTDRKRLNDNQYNR